MIEEAMLVRLFKDGTIGAFDEIYGCYYKPVCSYISKMVGDKTLAEDLAQETLIKVFGSLKEADESKGLSSWIFRIAHNTCIDHYRKSRPYCELTENISCRDTEHCCPEHMLLSKEKQHMLREALQTLGRKYRAVLLLRACLDMSYREIAFRMNIKESTVKTLIHRGRRQLQKAYAQVY